MFVNDPKFGKIINYERLREAMRHVYDSLYPEFDMLESMRVGTRLFQDDPGYMVAGGASMLAWMMLLAAEEYELAEELKDSIFTLGWTEEHCGSDLLSVRTQATPIEDDPEGKQYHVKGSKWIINNSYHADYHMVIAKIDPDQNGPRSLSLFLVPHSSTHSWERIETHVLQNMVLTKFEIDGPGRLVGKPGHGLSIQQRMAMPSKYQATYAGVRMVHNSIPATIDHLGTKLIFGDNPVNFNNVFRQLYNLVLEGALVEYTYYRSVALSDSPYLQFYGTMLKSFVLLRANAILSENLLVAGSKGFVKESTIGRDAFDSFVLPVFDGHYTINTLMTAKHAQRYLYGDAEINLDERMAHLRKTVFLSIPGDQMNADTRAIRKPEFFDYAAYVAQFDLPITLDAQKLVDAARAIVAEIKARELTGDTEYRYKTGELLHWMESLLAACELWKLFDDDNYLNGIIRQYNHIANYLNTIIAEGDLEVEFLLPMRHLPLPEVENAHDFLLNLFHIEKRMETQREAKTPAGD